MAAITILTFSLLSIATAMFEVLRSGRATHKDYVANSIITERLTAVRHEFASATSYLDAYGAPGTEFSPAAVSPASGEAFGNMSVIGRVTATPFLPGPPNALIITVELEYEETDGAPITAVIESFLRCEQP